MRAGARYRTHMHNSLNMSTGGGLDGLEVPDGKVASGGAWGQIRLVDAGLQAAAEARFQAAVRANPWLEHLDGAVQAIARANVTHRKRYTMMRQLADRINAAVMPHSACGRGCDSCCHIAVEMSGWEAQQLAHELGLKVLDTVKPGNEMDRIKAGNEEIHMKPFGKACGFLKNGECSIFASRPLACRLHHSLNTDAQQCSPSIPPDESFVPSMNLGQFWMAYGLLSLGSGSGDISEFFAEARRQLPPVEEVAPLRLAAPLPRQHETTDHASHD